MNNLILRLNILIHFLKCPNSQKGNLFKPPTTVSLSIEDFYQLYSINLRQSPPKNTEPKKAFLHFTTIKRTTTEIHVKRTSTFYAQAILRIDTALGFKKFNLGIILNYIRCFFIFTLFFLFFRIACHRIKLFTINLLKSVFFTWCSFCFCT